MNCRKVRKLISVELDGSLDEKRHSALRSHLRQCEGCRAFQEQLTAAVQKLLSLDAPDPRPGFAGRTLARLPQDNRRPAFAWLDRWLGVVQPAPAAACTLALILGVFLAVSMNGHAGEKDEADPTETLFAQSFDLAPTDSIGERYLSLLDEGED